MTGSTSDYPRSTSDYPREEFTGAQGEKGSTSSIGEVLNQLTTDVATLMKQEVALAKAEVRESATQAGKGAGMFGGAAFAGNLALLFLSIALWWLIASWVGFGWSALIVGVLWGIVAAVLAMRGKKSIQDMPGVTKTAETAKQIPDALKGKEHRQ